MLSESSAPILSIQGPGEHLKFFGNSLSCLSSHTDKVNLFSPLCMSKSYSNCQSYSLENIREIAPTFFHSLFSLFI